MSGSAGETSEAGGAGLPAKNVLHRAVSVEDLQHLNEAQDLDGNLDRLAHLGGVDALPTMLGVDVDMGLPAVGLSSGGAASSMDLTAVERGTKEMEARVLRYGSNRMPEPEMRTWFALFCEAFEDPTVLVLMVAAVVSLAIGISADPSKGWVEGVAILAAVLIVAVVTATNDYSKELQFRQLNAVKDNAAVQVRRGGEVHAVWSNDIVVGDIVLLESGCKIPADGVIIGGSEVTANESVLTGEPEDRVKSEEEDPFLLSGCEISGGQCEMIVIAVGANSSWGRIRAKLDVEQADTPLQEKLNDMASLIGYIGMAAAGATFLAMLYVWYTFPEQRTPGTSLMQYVLDAFIMGVTIVVVAVPEGLPLAVTISLAYSTQKMMRDQNLIRVLAACETMGNATTICCDKTGTLTENRMTVVEGWFGGAAHSAVPALEDLHEALVTNLAHGIATNTTANLVYEVDDSDKNHVVGTEVLGNKTEGALLVMIQDHWDMGYKDLRHDLFHADDHDRLFTFTSDRKRMSVLLTQPNEPSARLYCKGAAEIILDRCVATTDNMSGDEIEMDDDVREELATYITSLGKRALRAVALAHRNLGQGSAKRNREELDLMHNAHHDAEALDALESDLVLDAIVAIKDPLRKDVTDAVRTCQAAGVVVRMVTGDNLETARAIARECGILTDNGLALEGPQFRRMSPAQVDDMLPRLQVLARSSPEDKYLLVSRLNGHNLPTNQQEWEEMHCANEVRRRNMQRGNSGASSNGKSPRSSGSRKSARKSPKASVPRWDRDRDLRLPGYQEEWQAARDKLGTDGEIVGVTGDGTNDGPALRAADVGLSMGLSGTDVAKEASDIVILDDRFSSITKAVLWGRCVFDNIRKFLQFQLTVNLVALTLTFLSAVSGYDPPLNAVMMLWVNLIMDTMGALALGTEAPTRDLLDRRPYRRSASLISEVMWRNIAVQAVFQIAVLVYLLLWGHFDFGVTSHEEGTREHFTILFNTFVFCQVFNEFNSRSIGSQLNVFRGLLRNFMFPAIIAVTMGVQYLIIQYGGEFTRTVPLDRSQWIGTVLLASLTLPLGALMRLIPVHEGDTNFAPVSEIETDGMRPEVRAEAIKKFNSAESSTLSQIDALVTGILYFAVVVGIPVLFYTYFQDTMVQRLIMLTQEHVFPIMSLAQK